MLLRTLMIAALAAGLAVPPAAAQDGLDFGELKRRLDEAWEGLVDELEPRIDNFSALVETLRQVDSLEHYEDPEILPNGDIVIRRRADAPPLDLREPRDKESDLPEAEGPAVPI